MNLRHYVGVDFSDEAKRGAWVDAHFRVSPGARYAVDHPPASTGTPLPGREDKADEERLAGGIGGGGGGGVPGALGGEGGVGGAPFCYWVYPGEMDAVRGSGEAVQVTY